MYHAAVELPAAAHAQPQDGSVLGSIDLADTRFGTNKWFPEGMSAHLWWPDDHTWCVATDIDLMTTYLGASAECVGAVLADDALEALPATPDQNVTWDSDTVNPLAMVLLHHIVETRVHA